MLKILRFILTPVFLLLFSVLALASEPIKGPMMCEMNESLENEKGFVIDFGNGEGAFFPSEITEKWKTVDGWNEKSIADGMSSFAEIHKDFPKEKVYVSENGSGFAKKDSESEWTIDIPATVRKVSETLSRGGLKTSAVWTDGEERYYESDFGGNYVDVDLSNQKVTLFLDYAKIGEWPCVTGNADGEHDTPPGIFQIAYKQSPTTLCGYREDGSLEYASDVTYWMPFNRGIGLHDATWRSVEEFGGDTYTYNGSHGCVNLPFEAAETIYWNVWAGFTVVVH